MFNNLWAVALQMKT